MASENSTSQDSVAARDSTGKTLLVALSLCVVCSIIVSGTAVILKPQQDANRVLDRNKNILSAAGMFDADTNNNADVEQIFSQFVPRIADIRAGRLLDAEELAELQIDIASYDQRAVINHSNYSEAIPANLDVASIRRRVVYPMIYVMENNGTDSDAGPWVWIPS